MPLGWTSWWPDTPELCFPAAGTTVCSAYDKDGASFSPMLPADTRAIDPQIDWEQFKLFVVNTLIYLPENQKQTWLDMLGIWEIGADSDPGFDQRIELHMPSGNTYVARSFGSEEICFELCKTVQRGIGARILEFANQLLNDAYENTPVTQNGVTWYLPLFVDGNPVVKFDPELEYVGPNFTTAPPPPTCNASDNSGCACNNNGACLALESYVSLPDFVRTAMRDFKMADPTMKGIY
jgi:hypothetical protein